MANKASYHNLSQSTEKRNPLSVIPFGTLSTVAALTIDMTHDTPFFLILNLSVNVSIGYEF
jgi:hypothetical protein